MELTVNGILPGDRDFLCVDEIGNTYRVDLYVDGGLGDDAPEPEDMIGRTVIVDSLSPYLFIANGVRFK